MKDLTLYNSPRCPWCKSPHRGVTIDRCYNDWHLPLCANCGDTKYTHGYVFSCNNYQPAKEAA